VTCSPLIPRKGIYGPDRVAQALTATEDSRLCSNPGIDPVSVLPVGWPP
jgi:membrane peptidoglycan carboxypeptidase